MLRHTRLSGIHRIASILCIISLLAAMLPGPSTASSLQPPRPISQAITDTPSSGTKIDSATQASPHPNLDQTGDPSQHLLTTEPITDTTQEPTAGIDTALSQLASKDQTGLLPGKAGSITSDDGVVQIDFPSDSVSRATGVSVGGYYRLADRSLPTGLSPIYPFTVSGSGISVTNDLLTSSGDELDKVSKSYKLTITLDPKVLPGGASLYFWDKSSQTWQELDATFSQGQMTAKTNLLTDFVVAAPQGQTLSYDAKTTQPLTFLTFPEIPYVGGFLGYTGGAGRSGEEVATDTWKMPHVGNFGAQITRLLLTSDGTYYALDSGGWLRRSDDGATWTLVFVGSTTTGQITHPAASGSTLFAAMSTDNFNSVNCGVYKSTDRGSTWSRIFQSPDGGWGYRWKGVSINVSPANTNVMWFTGTRRYVSYGTDRVWLSTNGGSSWTQKYDVGAALQQVVPDSTDASTGYLVRNTGIFKTTNQGSSWTQVSTTGQFMSTLQDLIIDPSNDQNLWYASGSSPDGIEISTNGGTSWTHVRVLPVGFTSGRVVCLGRDSDGNLLAGLSSNPSMPSANLFKSTDAGLTWQDVTGDMTGGSSLLHDLYGPLRVLAILAQAPEADEATRSGCQECTEFVDDPVNTTTGDFFYQATDLTIPGQGPSLTLSRSYNSKDNSSGPFGYGWTFSYGASLTEFDTGMVLLVDGGGRHYRFVKKDDGTYYSPPGLGGALTKNVDSTFSLEMKDQSVLGFDSSGKLTSIADKNGNELTLSYSGGRLDSVTDASSRSLSFSYTDDGYISQVTDPLDRTVQYGYTDGDLTSVTDMNGQTTSFSYSNHHPLTITDGNGHDFVDNTYDSSGRVLTHKDAKDNQTTYSYDPIAMTTTVTDPRSGQRVYSYDSALRTLSDRDQLGKTQSYTYDAHDNPSSITDRNGNVTKLAYNAVGDLLGSYDALGNAHNFDYDAKNNPTEERCTLSNPQNKVQNHSFEVDANGDGLPDNWYFTTYSAGPMYTSVDKLHPRYGTAAVKMTATNPADADGVSYLIAVSPNSTYALSYDVKTESLTPGTATTYGKIYIIEYNSSAIESNKATGLLGYQKDVFPNLSGTNDWSRKSSTFTTSASTSYIRLGLSFGNWGTASGTVWFDGVLLEPGSTASRYVSSTTYGYDDTGNLTSVTNALGKTTSFGYDEHGNQISVTDPLSRTTSFDYNSYGYPTTITNPAGKETTQDFDTGGRRLSVTDPLLHTTSFTYDNENRVTSVTDALGHTSYSEYDPVGNTTVITDANGIVTRYTYDENNNLHTVTDALDNTTTYGYDANNNRTSVQDANSHTTSYEFDLANRLTKITTPLSYVTRYGYDSVGNTKVITDANGTVTNLTYDALSRISQVSYPDSQAQYAYDSLGNRTAMTDTTGTTHYAYDTVGRLTAVTNPGGEVVEYSYNDAGQRSTLTYPDTKQVEYGYDQAGRLDTVTDWASREVDYSYDDAGRLTGAELPNSTSSSLSYDDANRLTQISHTSQISGTIESIDYQLDDVGNRMVMTDTSGATSYTYDDLYRLTGVTYPDSSSTSYEYDPVGNRTVMTTSLGTTDYSYDNDDRMTTAGSDSYTWDNNGNMESKTSGGVTTDYTYDYADRLTEVADGTNTYQYSYNGDGIRVSKDVNGTSTDYVWDLGLGLPVVLTDTNSIYLYGLDLIAQQQGADVSYYHPDGLGSVRNLTNSTGQIIGGYSYDVFGAVRSSSGTVPNDFQFAGEQSDPESGLYYLRARYYDPEVGRFIQPDPFPGLASRPQSLNPYVYVENNPVRWTDPSGQIIPILVVVVVAGVEVGLLDLTIMTVAFTSLGLYLHEHQGDVESAANRWGEYCEAAWNGVTSRSQSIWDSMTNMFSGKHWVPWPEDGAKKLPRTGSHPYIPPKQAAKQGKVVQDCSGAYVDEKGNRWVWDPKGVHWDVDHPQGGHGNITNEGEIHHKTKN